MKNLIQFLSEDLSLQDGKVVFVADKDKKAQVRTLFGKGKLKPLQKKIKDDLYAYSIYKAEGDESTDILKALKAGKYDKKNIDEFLNRSAIYMNRLIRQHNIEVIVAPKSSSDLNKKFAEHVKKRSNVDLLMDSFRKTPDISKIEIDRDHPQISDKIIDRLEKILEKSKKEGAFHMVSVLPQNRKFIKNLFQVVDEKMLKKIDGKNVLILDDITTSGMTAHNIYQIVKAAGADQVISVTLFKKVG